MNDRAGSPADPPPQNVRTSMLFTGLLMALLLGFLGLLGYGRSFLAHTVLPNVTVYLALMIGLTVGIWLLTWAYLMISDRSRRPGGAP